MGNLITLQMPVGRGRRWEGWAGRRRGGNDAGDVEIKPPPLPSTSPPAVPMLPWARQLQMLEDPISSPGCEWKQHRSADCFSSGGNDKHAAEQQSVHTVVRCKRLERERKLPDGRRYLRRYHRRGVYSRGLDELKSRIKEQLFTCWSRYKSLKHELSSELHSDIAELWLDWRGNTWHHLFPPTNTHKRRSLSYFTRAAKCF